MKSLAILILTTLSLAGSQTNLPLVHDSDVSYLGSFSLPRDQNGVSRFGYGGGAISAYRNPTTGVRSLFIGGHPHQEGSMAQVRIPDSLGKGAYGTLPQATWIQPFANVVDGSVAAAAGITTSNGNYIYGSLVYNGRLILAAGEWYGCTQQRSHGFSTLNLGASGDFRGFYFINALANVRSLGGPMAHIPDEWQATLGGPVIGGNFGTAIVSCQSAGPSLTVFNPDSLGMTGHRGTTLAQYPLTTTVNHTLCEGAQCTAATPENQTSSLYNLATRFGGMAFPAGTRSVILFGRQGTGPYCYGTAAECGNDPAEPEAKGPHAYPYRYQIWAYDALDLMKVKAGTLKTWEIKPYAYWGISALNHHVAAGHAQVSGAGYDPETRRLYVTTVYGENPRVDVFQVRSLTPPVVAPPDSIFPELPPVACDTTPCPSCPPRLPPVTITVEVPIVDTSVLAQSYQVPGMGVIRRIKTLKGDHLLLDLNGTVTLQKVK